MKDDKIYCENCKFLYEKFDNFYNNIIFKNDKEQFIPTPYMCLSNLEIKENNCNSPIHKIISYDILVDNPNLLNFNNTCKYYKRKWWKFWR
jgi:hypothetical protein